MVNHRGCPSRDRGRVAQALGDLKALWNQTLNEEVPPEWAELLKKLR